MTKDNPGFIENLNPRDRETKILECDCGWKGKFAEGMETWDDDGEYTVCPRCLSTVAQIWFPTIQEMLDSGDPDEVRHAEVIVALQEAFRKVALQRPDQLPDLPGDDDLYLTWDADYSEGKDQPQTVIRHGDTVLFSEPACWQAIGTRYESICKILKEKYGQRVRDLVPTPASEMWLYGDKMGSAIRVSISKHVFGHPQKE